MHIYRVVLTTTADCKIAVPAVLGARHYCTHYCTLHTTSSNAGNKA